MAEDHAWVLAREILATMKVADLKEVLRSQHELLKGRRQDLIDRIDGLVRTCSMRMSQASAGGDEAG
eukprot:CAMPEP_0119528770 /NCGR_PEP_ID=MMETSP1344-20130328/42887_1 /TAXON_ID=236787 /ORGANISM="Florenciella parvula, Strain CCMP2471" /LENGTH=66 /DNA_ID=CAMNT_0007568221 /DNA_START=14 /DNA_END=210 /DNA_ORIENTATION=-